MTITTRIFTALRGELVGTDAFGNRYFRRKVTRSLFETDNRKREKRWVIYNGKAEPSKVPPQWHGWLHYTFDKVPSQSASGSGAYAWQKPPQPNLTGTTGAYLPPGHLLKNGRRAPATADYEPWKP